MPDEENSTPNNPFEVAHDEPSEGLIESDKKTPPQKADATEEEKFLRELEKAEKSEGDEDEGFFWLFRRIFIGLLKGIALIAVIGFIIWLVWGRTSNISLPSFDTETSQEETQTDELPQEESTLSDAKEAETKKPFWSNWFGGDNDEIENIPVSPDVPTQNNNNNNNNNNNIQKPHKVIDLRNPKKIITEPVPSPNQPSPSTQKNPNFAPVEFQDFRSIVIDAENVAGAKYQAGHEAISRSMQWLRRTKQFSEVGVTQVIQYSDPEQRGSKISEKLREGEKLLAEIPQLQAELQQEINYWNQKNAENSAQSSALNQRYKEQLQVLAVEAISETTNSLSISRQKGAESQTYLSVYSSLLKNIGNFERLLRQKNIPVYRPSGTPTQ